MSALSPTLSPALQRLGDVSVRLSVELGRTDLPLREVLALGEGSVVSLDRLTDELLDITANGRVIAHGEVIAQDGKFALRIVSLAGDEDETGAPPSSGPKPDLPPRPSPKPAASAPQEPVADTPEPVEAPPEETPAEEPLRAPEGSEDNSPAPEPPADVEESLDDILAEIGDDPPPAADDEGGDSV